MNRVKLAVYRALMIKIVKAAILVKIIFFKKLYVICVLVKLIPMDPPVNHVQQDVYHAQIQIRIAKPVTLQTITNFMELNVFNAKARPIMRDLLVNHVQ